MIQHFKKLLLYYNYKLVNKSNKYEIKIVESILIHKLSPNLNDRGSSFPLSILQ